MQRRNVPEDDPRLAAAKDIIARVQKRNNWAPGQTEAPKGDQEQEHGEDMHLCADGDESSMQAPDVDGDVEDQTIEHIAADGEVEEQTREPVAVTTQT